MALQQDNVFVGELKFNEPMSKHTTWRVGGNAEHYFIPADVQDLSHYLQSLDKTEQIFWLGLGSNLLVRDGGIKGSVIATANALNGIDRLDDKIVEVGAGVPCAILARFCARNNLVNGEPVMGMGVMNGECSDFIGAVFTKKDRFRGESPFKCGSGCKDLHGRARFKRISDSTISEDCPLIYFNVIWVELRKMCNGK